MQNNQKIPEGWSVKKLGECFSFLKTPSYSRAETTSDGEVHYIHYGDIHTKYPLHVCPEDIDIFVTNEQAQKGDFLQTGDLILLDASGRKITDVNIYLGLAKNLRSKGYDIYKGREFPDAPKDNKWKEAWHFQLGRNDGRLFGW